MSLKEAYSVAHTAQCRLHMAASEPDRNLRFVVGHLMHYEAVRLRIVEIEHDISKSNRASAVAFKGTGHVCDRNLGGVQKKPSTGQLGGRKSPPPPQLATDELSDDDDDDASDEDPWSGGEDDDEGGDGLSLERFPSASAAPPRPPPDLMPDVDNDDDDDFDEPPSPEEPDQATIEAAIAGDPNADLTNLYTAIQKCPCHKKHDAPQFENFWELPKTEGQPEGVTRAVAQVWV